MKRLHAYTLLACSAIAIAAPQYARADESKEHQVKAAFIYNFVKFVEWPEDKAIGRQTGIDICVFGESPMTNTGSIFKAASTPKLALSLVKENDVSSIASHCHVVFVSKAQQGRLGEVVAALKGKPVLTVSDIDGFAERGGMIGFVMNANKVKVEVNTRSVASAGMRVDAQLLEIALRVIDK